MAKIIEIHKKDNCTLKITEIKAGLRGTLYNENDGVISMATFYERDRDNTPYRVTEYFGFTNTNSKRIK